MLIFTIVLSILVIGIISWVLFKTPPRKRPLITKATLVCRLETPDYEDGFWWICQFKNANGNMVHALYLTTNSHKAGDMVEIKDENGYELFHSVSAVE